MFPNIALTDKWKDSEIDGIDVNLANFPESFRCNKCGNILRTENLIIKFDISKMDSMNGTIYPCQNKDCTIMSTLDTDTKPQKRDKFYLPPSWRKGITFNFSAYLDMGGEFRVNELSVAQVPYVD